MLKNDTIPVCFFAKSLAVLYFSWSFCCAQEVAEPINQEYAFIGEGPIAVLKNEVLKKHSIGINECEILVLFFNHDPKKFKSLIIKRNYAKVDDSPFGDENVSLVVYEALTLSEKSKVARGVIVDKQEKDLLKSQLLPLLVKSKFEAQSINARKMKKLHDERNCYIFAYKESNLIGGYIFNPQKGTRSEAVYSALWEFFHKYEKK